MKKYILGLTIAASTLSLVGCSDFLDSTRSAGFE